MNAALLYSRQFKALRQEHYKKNEISEMGKSLTDFIILSDIAKGSNGKIYKVKAKNNESIYIMKKINLSGMNKKTQEEAVREAKILRKVSHPHIIKFYTSFFEKNCLYIIMEYAEGGDLQKVL